MTWEKMNIDELADSLGIHVGGFREKQKLIHLIAKARKKMKLSQAPLAKKVGVTQGRIAQIELGVEKVGARYACNFL